MAATEPYPALPRSSTRKPTDRVSTSRGSPIASFPPDQQVDTLMTIRDGWPSSLRSRPAQGRSVPGTEFPDSSERRSHAHALTIALLASRSAARALRRFQPGTPAEVKSFPGDLVSAADRAAEAAIVGVLGRHRPRDAILSEEGRSRLSDSGLLWVIDPIDGTANYLRGAAPWAISVALVDEDGPAVGVVTIPPWRLQYSAVRGLGASLNGVTLAQRTAVDPRGALVSTGLSYRPALRARWLRALSRAVEHVADIRRSGSSSGGPLRRRRRPDGRLHRARPICVGCGCWCPHRH